MSASSFRRGLVGDTTFERAALDSSGYGLTINWPEDRDRWTAEGVFHIVPDDAGVQVDMSGLVMRRGEAVTGPLVPLADGVIRGELERRCFFREVSPVTPPPPETLAYELVFDPDWSSAFCARL